MISSIDTGPASFWQTDTSILDHDFETRYSTEIDDEGNYKTPSQHTVFVEYADTVQKLPIEGTMHYGKSLEQDDIYGSY